MDATLTREQVRQVDRIAIEEYHIPGIVLMEDAGCNAARIILEEIDPTSRVVIFCGTGNNGGDGFVIARHLRNAGVDVAVALAGDAERLSPDAATNHRICVAMGIPIKPAAETSIEPDDCVVDALLGTGFTGDVREPLASVIRGINDAAKKRVVAIDVPSGLDCDTGEPANACIRADLTITFVANKVGYRTESGRTYTGRVRVADIGAPPEIIKRLLQPDPKA